MDRKTDGGSREMEHERQRKTGRKGKKWERSRHNERQPRITTETLHNALSESRKCCV